jgi:hypothetical protein
MGERAMMSKLIRHSTCFMQVHPAVVRCRATGAQRAVVVLVNLEVPDNLRIVVIQSIPVRAYNFGAVCDFPGIIPEPNGAAG